jgi:phenylacetate-CoA ligase
VAWQGMNRNGASLDYSRFLRGALQPLWMNIARRSKMPSCRTFLETSQWWNTDNLRRYQVKALNQLLTHAYRNVSYWTDRFDALGVKPGDMRGLEDLCRLPITEKSDIRANKDRMIASNWRGKTWTKSTGGSTGVPLELDYTPESYDWRVACSKRGYSWAMGCEDGKKQAYIWGVAIGKVSRWKKLKEDLHHAVLRQKYFNCFGFDAERMGQCLDSLNKFQAEYIIGYTNPLYEFARFVNRTGRAAFAPKAVLCAAEKLHPFQREVLESVFNCPAFNTYGSREFMLIAAECEKHEGLHVSMENLIVEVIKEDGSPAMPGETGDLIITDLHNYGMPFIRYRIGDMAVATDHVCSCGRGLTLLADVVGRSLDVIRTRDGRNVPGEFFPHLMKEFKGIDRFQVIQDEIDHLEVKIVKNAAFSDGEYNFIRNEIVKVVGGGMRIDYSFVASIPLTRTGKFRVTISEI